MPLIHFQLEHNLRLIELCNGLNGLESKLHLFRSIKEKEESWIEVSRTLNHEFNTDTFTTARCKKRWENMNMQFRKELAKVQNSGPGATKWKLFDTMKAYSPKTDKSPHDLVSVSDDHDQELVELLEEVKAGPSGITADSVQEIEKPINGDCDNNIVGDQKHKEQKNTTTETKEPRQSSGALKRKAEQSIELMQIARKRNHTLKTQMLKTVQNITTQLLTEEYSQSRNLERIANATERISIDVSAMREEGKKSEDQMNEHMKTLIGLLGEIAEGKGSRKNKEPNFNI
mmetsp:Transcript_34198/g.43675  ORF Transcript_34198/g.43675 Transcript_34198/m.43675 type:complete len:287 (-) Transcript_34198:8-868(-)